MPSKEEFKMYDTHCKGMFETIIESQEEARKERKIISDRLFKTNGKRSVVASIEDNKKALDRHVEMGERQVKTVKTLKASFKDGIDIKGYSAMDVLKILIGLGIFVMLVVSNYDTLKGIATGLIKKEIAHVED
jgi:hypothetical protein